MDYSMQKKVRRRVTMDNNDILIRLRYAMDIKDIDMIEIFKLGGVEVTKEQIIKLLTKNENNNEEDIAEETENNLRCTNRMLESFLNGFIIFRRGKQEPKSGQPTRPIYTLKEGKNSNNVMLKKIKIALALSSEDMLNIFDNAGVKVTKGELSAFLRNEEHKHYRICQDRYARNFLKGLTMVYRK